MVLEDKELTIEQFLRVCKNYNPTFTVEDLQDISYPISSFTETNVLSVLERKWKRD